MILFEKVNEMQTVEMSEEQSIKIKKSISKPTQTDVQVHYNRHTTQPMISQFKRINQNVDETKT